LPLAVMLHMAQGRAPLGHRVDRVVRLAVQAPRIEAAGRSPRRRTSAEVPQSQCQPIEA